MWRNATSSWENVLDLDLVYDDEKGNFENFEITGKARLPYLSEVYNFNGKNLYLYEYLDGSNWLFAQKQKNNITGSFGYWTFASDSLTTEGATAVISHGYLNVNPVSGGSGIGVRPVIMLSRNSFK